MLKKDIDKMRDDLLRELHRTVRSLSWYSVQIGITYHVLYRFLYEKKNTHSRNLILIKNFLDKVKKIL